MEIWNLHLERTNRQTKELPSFMVKQTTTIRRIGLERGGLNRSYCAMFTPDGKLTYQGRGKGFEGNANGQFDRGDFWSICLYLDELNLESFADDYQQPLDIQFEPDALTDSYLLFDTKEFTKTIAFHECGGPPLLRIVKSTLDNLLDSAEWDKKGFFLQRDLSVKPPVKRKWG